MMRLAVLLCTIVTGTVFLANYERGDTAVGCVITYDYVDTASAYAKKGNHSVGTFHVIRKYFGDSLFIEETTASKLLVKKRNNSQIYGLDTFKVINGDWHQIYMGKTHLVYSKSHFSEKKSTTQYYSWLMENNKAVLVGDEIVMNNDTLKDNPPEMFYYVLKPADTVRLNDALCYEYTKYDGKNKHEPLGKVYFNYEKGVVRFKSAADPFSIFDMVNYKKSIGCK